MTAVGGASLVGSSFAGSPFGRIDQNQVVLYYKEHASSLAAAARRDVARIAHRAQSGQTSKMPLGLGTVMSPLPQQKSPQRSRSPQRLQDKVQSSQQNVSADSAQKPVGAGVPLLLCLRQLTGGAGGLVGYTVILARSHRVVGQVTQVDHVQAQRQGPAYRLLRVERSTVLQPYGFKGRECHSIPLVPDIVPYVHPGQALLVITPPPGLLDLGRHELLLSFLSKELQPYAPVLPRSALLAASLPEGGQPLVEIRAMPRRQQLVDSRRTDLVHLITKLGGFAQAALLLGYRCNQRPKGYWDSLELLDMELDEFIAGCWLALPVAEDHEAWDDDSDAASPASRRRRQQRQPATCYYYNMATRSIKWDMPAAALSALFGIDDTAGQQQYGTDTKASSSSCDGNPAGDQEWAKTSESKERRSSSRGSRSNNSSRGIRQMLLDLTDERVMPSHSSLKAAGRYDLIYGVEHHGGFRAVAALLDRRPAWPEPLGALQQPKELLSAVYHITEEQGWTSGVLPTCRQLRQIGRDDVIKAILYHGGWRATADLLRLQCSRPPADAAAATPQGLAQQILQFMKDNPPLEAAAVAAAAATGSNTADIKGSNTTSSSRQRAVLTSTRLQAMKDRRQQQQQHSWSRMPTQRELAAAGRLDLVYWLQRHRQEPVRLLLGLQRTRKQLRKGVLIWESVKAAIAAGCHTTPDILHHISQHADSTTSNTTEQHYAAGMRYQQPRQQHGDIGAVVGDGQGTHSPQLQQQQQQQQQQPTLRPEPVVSREHLNRQLKVWCEEGKLVKVKRGLYQLLQ